MSLTLFQRMFESNQKFKTIICWTCSHFNHRNLSSLFLIFSLSACDFLSLLLSQICLDFCCEFIVIANRLIFDSSWCQVNEVKHNLVIDNKWMNLNLNLIICRSSLVLLSTHTNTIENALTTAKIIIASIPIYSLFKHLISIIYGHFTLMTFCNSIFISQTFCFFLCTLQFDNVNNCLNRLHTLAVGGLDGITTNDICTGKLQAILDLFYALSVYKQAKQKSGVPINKQLSQSAAPQATLQQIHQPLTQQTQLGPQPNTVNASNEMLNR